MTAPVRVGDVAPDFVLPDHGGHPVRLSDFRGQRVLLFFYPKAMTSGCTVQAKALDAEAPALAASNTVVLGISPDPPERQQRFREKEALSIRLLSDVDHAVAQRYGAWGDKTLYGRLFKGIRRSQFIVDEQGVVVSARLPIAPKESVPEARRTLRYDSPG
jgi:peroxiredoxin Q/BCP